jgi:hypothetical protein
MGITITNSGQGSVVRFRNLGRGGVMTSTKNPPVDVDAQAFFSRVTTAGGTLSVTEQTAVNQLVVSMKAAGIWTLMKAIYPMVGASAAACAQNLKSASFTGTFTSGWTYSTNGVTPNGTSAYMNTALNPVAQGLTTADSHLAYYARTAATTSDPAEIANYTDSNNAFVLQSKSSGGGNNRFFYTLASAATRLVATAPIGFMMGSSIANTRRDLYLNGISVANNTTTDNASLGNYSLYVGAGNIGGSSSASFTNSQCAYASIGNGLTSTQMSDLYTAVQAFQTTLGRQV